MSFIQQIDRSIESQLDLLAKIQQEITDLSLLKQEATDLISMAKRVVGKKASLGGAIAVLKSDLIALFDGDDGVGRGNVPESPADQSRDLTDQERQIIDDEEYPKAKQALADYPEPGIVAEEEHQMAVNARIDSDFDFDSNRVRLELLSEKLKGQFGYIPNSKELEPCDVEGFVNHWNNDLDQPQVKELTDALLELCNRIGRPSSVSSYNPKTPQARFDKNLSDLPSDLANWVKTWEISVGTRIVFAKAWGGYEKGQIATVCKPDFDFTLTSIKGRENKYLFASIPHTDFSSNLIPNHAIQILEDGSFLSPQSERSDSLKELEDSPEPPNSLEDSSGSNPLRSTPTLSASLNITGQTSQSGQTSEIITQKEEQQTYIQLDFLAQEPAAPESGPDSITQNQDSGLKLCGVSVKEIQLSWLLSNLKALSTEDCEQSLEDSEWQATVGSIRSLYQGLLSALPNGAKDSLLLPTVTSSAGGSSKTNPAGGNKLIAWFKSNGLLENGLVLNAQIVEQLLGFPMDWTAPLASQEGIPASTSDDESSLAEQSSPSKPLLPSDSSKSSGRRPINIDNRIWFDAEDNTAQIGFHQKAKAEKWGQFLAQVCTLAESYKIAPLEGDWKYGLKLAGVLPDTVKELAIANLDSSFPDRAYGGQAPRRVFPKAASILNEYRVTRNLEEIWKGDSIQEGIDLFEAEKENPISKTLSLSGPNYESIEIWKRPLPDEAKPSNKTAPDLELGDVVELGNYLGDWEVRAINGTALTVSNLATGHTKEVFLANVKSKKHAASV